MKLARCTAILVLAGLVLLTACTKSPASRQQTAALPPPATPPVSPEPAPTRWTGDAINFTFTTADGEQLTADSYAGKPLVLNFWAAW